MAKYVDDSGLQYFWSKLKTKLAGKAEVGHTHDYSAIKNTPEIPQIAIVTWTTDDMT